MRKLTREERTVAPARQKKSRRKEPITIRVAPAVKEFFVEKAGEEGSYQSLIHEVLANHVADAVYVNSPDKKIALAGAKIAEMVADIKATPGEVSPELIKCLGVLESAVVSFRAMWPYEGEDD